MPQSRVMSMVEAISNVVVGYGLAVGMQVVLFPAFGLHPSLSQSMKIGIWFTLVSLARSYLVRRLFECFRRDRAV